MFEKYLVALPIRLVNVMLSGSCGKRNQRLTRSLWLWYCQSCIGLLRMHLLLCAGKQQIVQGYTSTGYDLEILT